MTPDVPRRHPRNGCRRAWIATCTAMALAAAVNLGAQSTSSSTAQNRADKVTLIGCLERTEPSAIGTSGTTGRTRDDMPYLLANVTSGSSTTSDESRTASAAPSATAYRLDVDDAKVSPHVGEKVMIEGTIDRAASQSSTRSSSSTAYAPILQVDNITLVSTSCR